MLKNFLKYIISLVVAGGLLYWTLKDYNFAENFEKLKSAHFFWFFVSAILTIVAHTSRAIRGKMLLEPMGYKPSTYNATIAVFLGYFANYLVPRLGEVTRCTTLATTEKIPFEKSFGTVITERIVDVFVLLLLLILNFILEFDRLSSYFLDFFESKFPDGFNVLNIIVIIIALLILVFLSVWFWRNQKEKILRNSFISNIIEKLKGLLDGLLSIKDLKNPGAFLAHTVLIWIMYFFMTYVMFFAFDDTSHLGLLAGLSTMVMGAIGIAAPTPGGLGTYHALVGGLLVLYGLSSDAGKTLAILLHGSQMVITLSFGIIAFILLFFQKRKLVA